MMGFGGYWACIAWSVALGSVAFGVVMYGFYLFERLYDIMVDSRHM